MTTTEFLQDFVSPSSHKIAHNHEEYMQIKKKAKVIKATTFYQIYQHNVFETDGRLSMREFFRVCGQYFYYDKMVCTHGTEFYYYIIFNGNNPMYQLTKALMQRRIDANTPETLDDLEHVIEAVTKDPSKETQTI